MTRTTGSTGWGIAGTGRIARQVGALVAQHPDMHVAAVSSRDAGRAAALGRELGAAAAHDDPARLAQDPGVDAVYVATPHAQHAEVVLAALEQGTPVLCEKPLTHSLAETERLAAAATRTGTFLMEGMWTRFNPLVDELARLVRDGALGEPRSLQASLGFAAPYDPSARLWSPELGGGALLDLGVYTVDLARLLLGEPDEVRATGSRAASGVDAEAAVVLRFPGGAHALLQQSLLTTMPTTAVLHGSRGWAELGPKFYSPTQLVVQVEGADPLVRTVPDRQVGFVRELEEVARCVREGRTQSDVVPLASSVATARVLDEALRLV